MSSNTLSEIVGIIIGRFQILEICSELRSCLESIIAQHDKTIIVLDESPALSTKHNPLDFETRKNMMLSEFHQLTIFGLTNMRYDDKWSDALDTLIACEVQSDNIMLYGSKEEFFSRYTGKYPRKEVMLGIYDNSHTKRNAKLYSPNRDFREGMFHAVMNQYPKVFPTVDVAVLKDDMLMLARKPHEPLFRFIGGFTDPTDDDYECAARREVKEEAGIEVSRPEYIGSARIDDWRYRREEDFIITLFFMAEYESGIIAPHDDIAEIRLVHLSEFTADILVPEHIALYNLLNAKLKFKN